MKQETHRNILDTSEILTEDEIKKIVFSLLPGDRIFFFGDLGAGKSSLIRALLRAHFHDDTLMVRSPTYTYFQKYGTNIYHFDLYRLTSFDDFFLIGGQDIIDDPESICLIEWPELISERIQPTIHIEIEKVGEKERRFTLRSATE